MRKNLLLRARGVSLMIGYVLLIVIAIAIAVAVFSYLQLYLPKDQAKCPSDVNLIIDEAFCENGLVNLSVSNRGLFSVDRVQIRIGESNRIAKQFLNEDSDFIFENHPGTVLKPGESWNSPDYPYTSLGSQELEIEPFMFIDNEPALCDEAVVSKTVVCG